MKIIRCQVCFAIKNAEEYHHIHATICKDCSSSKSRLDLQAKQLAKKAKKERELAEKLKLITKILNLQDQLEDRYLPHLELTKENLLKYSNSKLKKLHNEYETKLNSAREDSYRVIQKAPIQKQDERDGNVSTLVEKEAEREEIDYVIQQILSLQESLNTQYGQKYDDTAVSLKTLSYTEIDRMLDKLEMQYDRFLYSVDVIEAKEDDDQAEKEFVNETIQQILSLQESLNSECNKKYRYTSRTLSTHSLQELDSLLDTLEMEYDHYLHEEDDINEQESVSAVTKDEDDHKGVSPDCLEVIQDIFRLQESLNTQFDKEYKYTFSDLKTQRLRDLDMLLEDLETEYDDYLHPEEDIIDPLSVLEKYQNLSESKKETRLIEDQSWKKFIPASIKAEIRNWSSLSKEVLYEEAKGLLHTAKGKRLQEIRNFVSEFSNVVYADQDEEAEEVNDSDLQDDIADAIMSQVEMIILPHIEVLERSQQHGGKIIFGDLWSQPFKESMRKEVKDRDEWKCVICEVDKDLHVHHKIPRKLGGLHHMHNLVTLCSSCHSAVETADVQSAFNKCLSNYRKNKIGSRIKRELKKDKTLLRKEVEDSLDSLLVTLNNRDEHELVKDVAGIIERLQVIFYE